VARRPVAALSPLPLGGGAGLEPAARERVDPDRLAKRCNLMETRISHVPSLVPRSSPIYACTALLRRTSPPRTFVSSCSTPWCAEYVSWQIAARMPASLLAAIEAPTPDPQTRTPRSAPPF